MRTFLLVVIFLCMGQALHAQTKLRDLFPVRPDVELICEITSKKNDQGFTPDALYIHLRPGEGIVQVRYALAQELGHSTIIGELGRLIDTRQKFSWELRNVPKSYLPNSNTGYYQSHVFYNATINLQTLSFQLRSDVPMRWSTRNDAQNMRGSGRCRQTN